MVKRASCALLFLLLLSNGKIATRYCANKGVPIGISESDNVGFRRFECLYYEGRVKLTEGTGYTYVVEGNDAPGTGRVVLTGWAITVAPSRRRLR